MITIFNGKRRGFDGNDKAHYAKLDFGFRRYLHHFKGPHLAVFLAICLHADEGGWAWPGAKLLADETGYNIGTVRKVIADLCGMVVDGKRVLLKYQPKGTEDGQFASNRYLIFPSQEEIAANSGRGIHQQPPVNGETGNGEDDSEGEPGEKENQEEHGADAPCDELQPTPSPVNCPKCGERVPWNPNWPTDVITCAECGTEIPVVPAVPIPPQEPLCEECGRPRRTTREFPRLDQLCQCGREELPEAPPVNSWREDAGQPWATWGADSDEFARAVQRYGEAGREVQRLGYELERQFGMRPRWDKKKAASGWGAGLHECLEITEGDHDTVIQGAQEMREDGLCMPNPYSLHKKLDDIMAKRRSGASDTVMRSGV